MNVVENVYGIKVYNVSAGRSVPTVIKERSNNKRKGRGEDYNDKTLQLIQDFEFPTAATKLKVSNDGQYLIAAGGFAPQMRIFDLRQLSLKCERHIDLEIVDFEILSEDYSKLAILRMDRNLEFHAQFGKYYNMRIPKIGRDLLYHQSTCDLYVCGASSDIYRINLEQGQFLAPFASTLPGINVCDQNPVHSLLCFGGENGILECWDPRTKKPAALKDVSSSVMATNKMWNSECEISALKFDTDGVTLGVGTNTGHCLLYDLRAPQPLHIKDHQYGYPIKTIHFQGSRVLSADSKILKIWEKSDSAGKIFANIEPPANINDVCLIPNTGLLNFACEQSKMLSYFIPELGPAPKWCSFLDSLTEELEEDKQALYDDYKFVTRDELTKLGLTKLIGTQYLRAYMHGFFMDMRLYAKMKAAVDPFEYENYRKEKIAERIEKQASTRIAAKKKLPTVNTKLASRLLAESTGQSLLSDDRFGGMFENPDFEVDENSEQFRMRTPKLTTEAIQEHFEKVDESEEEEAYSSDEDQDVPLKHRKAETQEQPKSKKVEFYELKEGHEHERAIATGKSTSTAYKQLSFSDRLSKEDKSDQENTTIRRNALGQKQMTFTISQPDKKNKKANNEEWIKRLPERRGVKELKLKKIRIPNGKRR